MNNNSVQKKAQGLPINIVVMLILGIIIFGLGMGLFSKISSSSEDEVDNLMNKVRTGITSLECEGDDWICSPSYTMKNGESTTFVLYIANKGDENSGFTVNIDTVVITTDGKQGINKSECGAIFLTQPPIIDLNIISGESAEIPFNVRATKVTKTPCNFVTTATVEDNKGLIKNSNGEKASIIIRVE